MADFDLTQSGQEIQNILDGAAMQTDLTAETERAEQAEQQLQGNIDAEELRAKAAEEANADDIDVIEGKIPAAASSENQLADKAFVNSSITTATATYRGAYNLVSDLHLTIDATEQQIAAALAGAINTADNNDYCFVQIPTADATPTQIAAIERYKFNGTAWAYEYTLNNSGFTADQWAALNSGITTGLVAKLAALPTNDELTLLLDGKQDVLTFDNVPTEGSNNPVKSGGVKSAIDSEKERAQGAEQANAGNIAQVVAMIPAAASSENQLADKNFVNSSIATNTATYRGAYNEVSDLSLTVDATHEQIASALAGAISTADNNDYCFVQVPTADATPTQIAAIERYKFNGEAWAYEYTLNNSGFTADQWAAINSGITSGLVAKLAALPTNDDLVAALAGKQPMLTFDNVPTESSTNPVKSGGVYAAIAEEAGTRAAAIAAIVALIPSAASALNQLADKAFVNSAISTATAVFKGTFNVVADLELNYNASQAQIALMLGSKIASADNNDYCFVQIPTSNETPLEIARTDRYKYNGTAWAYEYTLNNSGFTAAQWAAINSGITSLLKDKLIDLPTATELTTQLAAKQNALTFDTTPTEGSTNPVTSDGIHAAIDTEKARALAVEQGLQDDYDDLYALYQTLEGGSIIPVAAADWPVSNPQQNVIYRVANSATPTAYSDYMYNGTTTLLLATFTFPGIDSEPTPDSTNLVTSGGTFDAIMQNGSAFDLSAYNAVGGTLATYADLSAALTALNALPAAYKKGGMSMKFVLSSDNKYVQARCISNEFTTDVAKWCIEISKQTFPTYSDDEIIIADDDFDVNNQDEEKVSLRIKKDEVRVPVLRGKDGSIDSTNEEVIIAEDDFDINNSDEEKVALRITKETVRIKSISSKEGNIESTDEEIVIGNNYNPETKEGDVYVRISKEGLFVNNLFLGDAQYVDKVRYLWKYNESITRCYPYMLQEVGALARNKKPRYNILCADDWNPTTWDADYNSVWMKAWQEVVNWVNYDDAAKMSVSLIIVGGDFVSGGTKTPKIVYQGICNKVLSLIESNDIPVLFVIGNHDTGEEAYTDVNDVPTKANIKEYLIAPMVARLKSSQRVNIHIPEDSDALYYHFDDTERKVRNIIINDYDYPRVTFEALGKTWLLYTGTHNNASVYDNGNIYGAERDATYYSKKQLEWLVSVLNNVPSDYIVVTHNHVGLKNSISHNLGNSHTALKIILAAFNNKESGSVTVSAINGAESYTVNYDFTSLSTIPVMHHNGHVHKFAKYMLSGATNYPCIQTICTYEENEQARYPNSAAFASSDIISIDTDTKKMYVLRYGNAVYYGADASLDEYGEDSRGFHYVDNPISL